MNAEEIDRLQELKEQNRRHGTPEGMLSPEERGRMYALEREPSLPSDIACASCGACIEHGDECFALAVRSGKNDYGAFVADECDELLTVDDVVLCPECVQEVYL